MAEDEAERISQRTKAALQAAKARGVKLGGFRGVKPTDDHRALATEAVKAKAARAAHGVLPLVEQLQAQGVNSLNAIAEKLNDMGRQTPRGGKWTATAVKRALERVV